MRNYGGHFDQLSKVQEGIEFYRIRSAEKPLKSQALSKPQSFGLIDMLI